MRFRAEAPVREAKWGQVRKERGRQDEGRERPLKDPKRPPARKGPAKHRGWHLTAVVLVHLLGIPEVPREGKENNFGT